MATYIKGVTESNAASIPFQADYKMLTDSLSNLQNRYNKGFDRVKSLYDSLMNKALSSADNEAFKNEYLKKADGYLRQMSGVDFSNANNVYQASRIFDPLVNDAQYVTDLAKTEAQRNEYQKLLDTKNSTDSKVRLTYSNIMEQYINIGQERLSKMKRDDGSIEAAQVHRFSPWEDPVEYASAAAKAQGVKYDRETIKGLYKIYTLNGPDSLGMYKNWFMSTIGDKFDNQFRIEAEVDHDYAVKAKMNANPNLTQEQVVQELANNFSGTYVKLYNDQINSLQTNVNRATQLYNKMKNNYPGATVPAKVYNQMIELKKQKDSDLDLLTKLKKEKGTDEEFRKKAVDLYLNNPVGTYVSAVKNKYADLFSMKQAYGETSVKIEADEVGLAEWKEQQEWARFNLNWQYKFKEDELNAKNAFKLKLIEENAKLAGTGFTEGAVTNVGDVGANNMYAQTISDLTERVVSPYVDLNTLATAIGVSVSEGGSIKTEDRLDIVSQAIVAKSKGAALTPEQFNTLNSYLGKVNPGFVLSAKHSFADIMYTINKGINSHSNLPYASKVKATLDVAVQASHELSNMYKLSSDHLKPYFDNKDNAYADEKYKVYGKYVMKLGNGGYSINFDAISKDFQSTEDRDLAYAALIPQYNKYKNMSGISMKTIRTAGIDPNKYDYTQMQNAIDNAEQIGYYDDKNKFVSLSSEETAKIKSTLNGAELLSKVFDPNLNEYARKVVNGVDYIEVKIPIKRTGEGDKNVSMATTLGLNPKGELGKRNEMRLLVPTSKAGELVSSKIYKINPQTGDLALVDNPFKEMMLDLAGRHFTQAPLSWVSTGSSNPTARKQGFTGLLNGGKSPFPAEYNYMIESGYLHTDGNKIYATFKEPGDDQSTTVSLDGIGVNYRAYKDDPQAYDEKIRSTIFEALSNYSTSRIQESVTKASRNKVISDPDAVKNDIKW